MYWCIEVCVKDMFIVQYNNKRFSVLIIYIHNVCLFHSVCRCMYWCYIEVFVKWCVYMQYNNNISLTADDSLPVLKMKKKKLLFHRSRMSLKHPQRKQALQNMSDVLRTRPCPLPRPLPGTTSGSTSTCWEDWNVLRRLQ